MFLLFSGKKKSRERGNVLEIVPQIQTIFWSRFDWCTFRQRSCRRCWTCICALKVTAANEFIEQTLSKNVIKDVFNDDISLFTSSVTWIYWSRLFVVLDVVFQWKVLGKCVRWKRKPTCRRLKTTIKAHPMRARRTRISWNPERGQCFSCRDPCLPQAKTS